MASSDREVQVHGTGSGDGEAPVYSLSTPATSRSLSGVIPMATSLWRWPSQPGKLPAYVQARFRVKAFGLLAIQSCIVLGIMIGVHSLTQGRSYSAMFFGTGVAMLIPMVMLATVDWKYPKNYALLVAITLLSGIFWGFSGNAFGVAVNELGAGNMHFQLFACICGTACAATVLAALLPCAGLCCRRGAAAAPLLLGWVVGATVEVSYLAYIGAPLIPGMVAAFLALVLFTVLLLDVGGLLVDCNPDEFMRIVISMNSTVLVMISLPIAIISACLMWSARRRGAQRPEAEGGARRPEAEGGARRPEAEGGAQRPEAEV